jgi:hypothetical protein
MKIRRKSSQSSFFVNLSSTIKSTVEGLESSYFPVRRVGPGYFGKISPKVMKISVHVKITQMAYNGPASMWSLAMCAGLKRLFMLAIVMLRFYYFFLQAQFHLV